MLIDIYFSFERLVMLEGKVVFILPDGHVGQVKSKFSSKSSFEIQAWVVQKMFSAHTKFLSLACNEEMGFGSPFGFLGLVCFLHSASSVWYGSAPLM